MWTYTPVPLSRSVKRELSGPVHCIIDIATYSSTDYSTTVIGQRIVTMIVFVNQMLLMRAGDVERNPGPGKGHSLFMYTKVCPYKGYHLVPRLFLLEVFDLCMI